MWAWPQACRGCFRGPPGKDSDPGVSTSTSELLVLVARIPATSRSRVPGRRRGHVLLFSPEPLAKQIKRQPGNFCRLWEPEAEAPKIASHRSQGSYGGRFRLSLPFLELGSGALLPWSSKVLSRIRRWRKPGCPCGTGLSRGLNN